MKLQLKQHFSSLLLFSILLNLVEISLTISALWPAAHYANGFIGEPLVDSSDFEKTEAFPPIFGGQHKRANGAAIPLTLIELTPVSGIRERRAPFKTEEDRWMQAMDNLRKPR
ncbi:hypothetical protein Mgra_00000317 [Meloidogyne graminicola]|uniref:Uncharacterized protein n=1 Tax=Meloidogyne graminicola TaxID=189291 RepID=A0A8T0A2X6_9BILA|nr:hypothetical protein Mgra_00000317 [Meloidogyne graminicola]